MGLSIRTCARHRDVPHVAAKGAIDTERITPLPDDTIDPGTADAQWAQNTLQPRKAVTPEGVSPSKARVLPECKMPEPGAPPLSMNGTPLLQARTVNEVFKTQLSRVKLTHHKKELANQAQVVAHVFKLARIGRDAWLNWPACISGQMASTFSVDAHQTHVALEAAVREYLIELDELHPRMD